ncbi:MAG: PAS domain S-box protein [Chitinophagaceae bacterium]|nr:PAS domain S-box protein [Chitinophagaceae bacterium]
MSEATERKQAHQHTGDLQKKYDQLLLAYDALFAQHEMMQRQMGAFPAELSSEMSLQSTSPIDIENALLESVRDYRDLFNMNPLPMWIYDSETTCFLAVNEAAISHYGYGREEFLQMHVVDIRPDSEKERLLLRGNRVQEDNRAYRGCWKHLKKNGEVIQVEISACRLSYQGKAAVLVLSNDITHKIHIESELIRSNRQLRAAQQIAQLGYWELNLTTLELTLSEQACRILDLPPTGKLSYEEFFNMVHPDDRDYFLEKQNAVVKGERAVGLEHRIVLASGEVKTLLEKGNLVLDNSGTAVVFEGIVQDISDRKKAAQAIADNERRMKNAQYVGSVGDWEYDCATKTLTWSDELYLLFAIDPQNGPPSLENFIGFYPEKDAARLRQLIANALSSGENYETDLQLSLPSAPEAYHYAACQVSKDRQGAVVKLYGIVQDITARKMAEIRLKNEHKQLRVLIDTLPDSIYIKDREGRKIVTNNVDLSLMGMTEEEALGKTDLEIFGPEIGGPRLADDLKVISTGDAIYNQEEHFTSVDGDSIWLLTSKVPLYDVEGKVTGLLGVGRIITERKRADEALKASNERFGYVTRATSDAVWDWDILNDHLYWGEGYEKIFGYSLEDTIANHIHSFDNIHPDDKKQVFDGIDELLRGTETNWSHEYRYRRADGEYVYVYDKAVVVRDDQGRAIRMIGAMQDISERKRSEEAVRKTQEKFTALVNTVDGIVWEADAETFQFTYVSRHAEKLLGYPVNLWIEEPDFWANHIHPDDREFAVNYCVEQTRKKKEHQFEYRMVAADGTVVWLADFVAIVEDQGSPLQLRGIMVDITERKKAEEALVAERKLLRLLIDNLPDYIYVKDDQMRHIINNKANVELLGFREEEETLNKTILDLLGNQTAAAFLKDDQQVLATGLPIIEREEPITNKDGQTRWLLTTKIPFKDGHQNTRGLVGISRDITERKKINEELEEKNRQLKQLSAHLQGIREEERKILAREVHDELGQLASVVKMDIDWLALRLPALEEVPRKRVQHAASTADLLINTIRKIAATLRPSMLDELGLNASLSWQCKEFSMLNGIPCSFEQLLDDTRLPMKTKNELFRICQESLTNVMRHANATQVKVQISGTSAGVRLIISDNGRGFDMAQKTNTLGLIGMRERALSVNGTLTVESKPGQGTIICAVIPKT